MRKVELSINANVTGIIEVEDHITDEQIQSGCVDILFAANTDKYSTSDTIDLGTDNCEIKILNNGKSQTVNHGWKQSFTTTTPTTTTVVTPIENTMSIEHYKVLQSITIPIEHTDAITIDCITTEVNSSIFILNYTDVYVAVDSPQCVVKAKMSAQFVYVNDTIFKKIK